MINLSFTVTEKIFKDNASNRLSLLNFINENG